MRLPYIFLALIPAALSGCANAILSDDKIQTNTALVLGVPDDSVRISNRRYDGATNTYYSATSGGRSYSCMINGGTVMTLGMVNAPQCTAR